MKYSKKVVIGIVFFFIILSLFSYLIFFNRNINKFSKKMDILQETFLKNNEINNIENQEKIVILSICDIKSQAVVKNAKNTSLEDAYRNVKDNMMTFIKDNNYDTEWIKIDIINDIEETTQEKLNKQLSSEKNNYYFRKGIILIYENREIILTESELNANRIINYKNSKLSLKRLNVYLKKCNEPEVDKIPDKLKTFTTISYFCDDNNSIYEMCNDIENMGRRKVEELQSNEIDNMVSNSTNYLFGMLQDNGKFIYGYSALKDKELHSYNMVRHTGTIWSLVIGCDKHDMKSKKKIEKSIDYLITKIAKRNDREYYLLNEEENEISLGGNGLALVALSEYTSKFDDKEYVEIAEKLGNGILSMQKENGKFVNKLSASDYSVTDKKEHYNYYSGEATLALGKLYGITQNSEYLEAGKKALHYFMETKYYQILDHWTSYAANEITKYTDEEEFYELGLRNIANNMDKILSRKTTSHSNFELTMQSLELYNRILERNIDVKYMQGFPVEQFKNLIDYQVQKQLNSYLYPEIAMYLGNPNKYYKTFFIRESDFRIRIDDIQHSIVGYYYYNKNCLNG